MPSRSAHVHSRAWQHFYSSAVLSTVARDPPGRRGRPHTQTITPIWATSYRAPGFFASAALGPQVKDWDNFGFFLSPVEADAALEQDLSDDTKCILNEVNR